MDGILLVSYLALAAAVLVQGVLFTLHAFENRRFARARWREKPKRPCPHGRVMLIAPCKGVDLGLAGNLHPLFTQDYGDYLLTFVTERSDDPAAAVIADLMRQYPAVAARLVHAGQATDTGQKVHNLLAATADLPPDVRYLAFVDSDARPHPAWLRLLVARLDRQEVGATTGYRWFVPLRPTLANFILYSINSAAAGLMGPGGHYLVWGGSWAIRRDVFDSIRLREAWHGTLSDDLVASRVLRRAKLDIEFEPRTMVASPFDYSFEQTFEFIRRQYRIGRFYMPGWWLGTFAVSTANNIAFWGGLLATAIATARGSGWAWIPAAVSGVVWGLQSARAWLRQQLGPIYCPAFDAELTAPRWFDILACPLINAVNWACLVGSLLGATVVWRGLVYRILPGGQIRIVQRLAETPADERPTVALPLVDEQQPRPVAARRAS